MRFVFSRTFYILVAFAVVPLSLAWMFPALKYAVLGYDILLLAAAVVDIIISRDLPSEFTVTREFEKRFAIGEAARVNLNVDNPTARDLRIKVKDEYPPDMKLDETREADFYGRALRRRPNSSTI